MQVLVVLLEVVGWPILLLAIVGMYNGKFFKINEFKWIFLDWFISIVCSMN
jgi:hypothetical protein